MGYNVHREHIDDIRREKFGIGTTKCNPLAGMLHEAIVHLSAELYQKDIHFISELLQNAEDNVYGNGVSPSLEMVLTEDDIARVGVQATLILFNNEIGFQRAHVDALCAVGLSTKKGKRDSGYIGEKGIGFKSVFLVTQTPYIISNGYRFRFTDEANPEAKIGYVVPEWTDVPTDADLRRVYGKQELPQTTIILPLRGEKVQPVRDQLKQVSPETLLFLSKLRQLVVREESGNSLCITRSDISAATFDDDGRFKVATVNLSIGSNVTHVSEECNYQLVQQQCPVTHRVEQRTEVENWDITIAFPLLQRINPGRLTGDIYAFLPSRLASGFPFIVNADFLLVSSRETLKFDSPWNIGILSCIPQVFLSAFKLFLQSTVPAVGVRKAYRYIPVAQPQNSELKKVQQAVLNLLKHEDCVLVDALGSDIQVPFGAAGGVTNVFCKPGKARLIRPEFHKILVAASAESNLNPAIRDLKCPMQSIPILKYRKDGRKDGEVVLACVRDAESASGGKIYLSPLKTGEWLSTWTSVFKPWVSVLFMPTDTVRVLEEFRQKSGSSYTSRALDYLISVVPKLSIKEYLSQLLVLVSSTNDSKFVILTTEFAYQCVQEQGVDTNDVARQYPSYVPIVTQSGSIRHVRPDSSTNTRILLPTRGSLWPKLSLNSWSSELVVMSDDYVRTPAAWPSSLKVHIPAKEDSLELESYRSYLKTVAGAFDIPEIMPPDGAYYSIPRHLSSNMTTEQACLLLEWLTTWLKSSTGYSRSVSKFFQNLKETPWLSTEGHGLRRPSSCFQKSTFTAFFKSSDLPFVHPSLVAFRSTLEDLGVITIIETGCEAVANYMSEIANDTKQTYSSDLEQATRLYMYLQKFLWKPIANSTRLKLFVPGPGSKFSNAWQGSECCVLQKGKGDDCLDNSLIVLEDFYPKSLLPFFEEVLQLPRLATVERYCQQWLKWRSEVHKITANECTRLWKVLCEKRQNCDAKVWKEFVAKAWVPSECDVDGTVQLLSTSTCFIPDDLDLRSLFPNVQFVWYPDNTEKMECAMNKIYAEMGVQKLSECVQAEFIIGETCGRQNFIGYDQSIRAAGNSFLCPGLFRATLGFVARKKYGLSSSKRQDLLVSLKGVAEETIARPLTRSYRISCISPPVTVSQDNVMALWSKKDGKLYCLDDNDPILGNPLGRRDFHVQLATTISLGLLSEHPLMAEDLTEFLIGLFTCGFESSYVEYELRRRNAKLYEEDELFLSQLQM
ncbi:unnamed protein product [Calypogeia fissa]